jgi:(2R)-ethylmalonyl-CoA mutase
MKGALVKSMAERMTRIGSGQQVVVGVNKWTEALPSPLVGGDDGGVFKVDDAAVGEALRGLDETRKRRDPVRVREALARLAEAAKSGAAMMEPSIECALARVTTGEWADTLRKVFGEYRAQTGVDGQRLDVDEARAARLRERIEAFATARGHRPRLVVGKPGLDGHSNGAEVIAVAARHAGFDVVYSGIRLTPEEIAQSAVEEDADLIGASILSGSHVELTRQLVGALNAAGGADIPLVIGGIIPRHDIATLEGMGVRKVFTPSDYELGDVMERMMDVIDGR